MLRTLLLLVYAGVLCIASWAYLAQPATAQPPASIALLAQPEPARLPLRLARQMQRFTDVERCAKHLACKPFERAEETCEADERPGVH
jgi:hypothetical protein